MWVEGSGGPLSLALSFMGFFQALQYSLFPNVTVQMSLARKTVGVFHAYCRITSVHATEAALGSRIKAKEPLKLPVPNSLRKYTLLTSRSASIHSSVPLGSCFLYYGQVFSCFLQGVTWLRLSLSFLEANIHLCCSLYFHSHDII